MKLYALICLKLAIALPLLAQETVSIPATEETAGTSIAHYEATRSRVDGSIDVAVFDAKGSLLAEVLIEWPPDRREVRLTLEDNEGHRLRQVYLPDEHIFRYEDLATKQVLESRPSGATAEEIEKGAPYTVFSTSGDFTKEEFLATREKAFYFLIRTYIDVAGSLGLRSWELNGSASNIDVGGDCNGPPPCSGISPSGIGSGFDLPTCCFNAKHEVDDLCRLASPLCSSCCLYPQPCSGSCVILDVFNCSCSQKGRACASTLDWCIDPCT